MDFKNYRMYILVNEDIEIGKGKLAGQVGHAVAVYVHKNGPLIKEVGYMDPDNEQKKIILYASEEKLLELEKENYITIRDKGYTELEPNTLTCVNLGLYRKESIPKNLKWIKGLKLVR